jgi:hypothetical protein
MSKTLRVSRRRVLQGLGVSLALPWLETFQPARALAADSTVAKPPLRMAFLTVPNGIHMQDWTPTTEGYGFRLPHILQPLANVQDDLVVLSGLTHDKGRGNGDGPGDHARSATSFLTGTQPRKTAGDNIRAGISVDQVAAQAVGGATRFPSLQLGCERGRGAGNCDSGYSCAYSSSVSWASETTPLGKEINPRQIFERLFGNQNSSEEASSQARRDALKQSVLDLIADDAKRLQAILARSDQRKLDEYLTGIRELERRLVRVETQEPVSGPQTVSGGQGQTRPQGIPDNYEQHIRLMCDMIVLAFQSDATRICTFMLADEGSNRSYGLINIPDGHHDLSHHGGDSKKHAKIREINRFHIRQFAYLLDRLKSIKEGESTLLDQCMIVYGSGISDGNRHNHENLPVLLAGRAGGSIDTGRHVRYEEEVPMCNLFLSMLDRMGAPVDFLGDSTGRLGKLQS